MPVGAIEGAAIRAGKKSTRQWHDGTLRHFSDAVAQHKRQATSSPQQVQHLPPERPPAILRHPNLAATRIIHAVRNPAKRSIVSQRSFQRHFRSAISIIDTWL